MYIITYRSYKNFNREQFLCDLASAPFHAAQVFDTVDDAYWFSESLLLDVVNKHAPLKKRVIKQRQIPYMNSMLRKQNNVRDRFKRIWLKNKSMKNREAYVRHRNLSTKLRKQSLNKYLKDKCTINNTHNNKEFWKITKPFMSHKGSSANTDISLIENDAIINDQTGVATVLNDYYVNVTKSIGEPDLLDVNEDIEDVFLVHESHESVQYIEQYMKDQYGSNNTFTFSHVTMNDVLKELRSINIRKTTGCDLIPGKLIKEGAEFLCKPIHSLINKCIDTCTFPNALKLADVVPIFKKNDMLNKMNYRPISILSCISKIFEKLLISQLRIYFDDIFSQYLSGYRASYGCQDVLLHFINICKRALDDGNVCMALLTDLSKAFDCLPYRLLICKLRAHGLSVNACELLKSYFCERKQRVKLGDKYSDWLGLSKGVPQGSLMGPFIFNIFSNDLLLLLEKKCHVFNYADDNSILCKHRDYDSAYNDLLSAASTMIHWYKMNCMQANPEKFQFIIFDKERQPRTLQLNHNVTIQSVSNVKLLGVNIDVELNFNHHIALLCNKAGRQINALSRLSNVLNVDTKMLILQSFILSHFMYCCIIWHFCSISDTKKIEKMQLKALRHIYKDYTSSYEMLREKCNRPMLLIERQRAMLLEVYKCIHELGPRYRHGMFSQKSRAYDYRDPSILTLPKYNTITHGKKCFMYEGAKLWNSISNGIKTIENISEFKTLLKKWNGSPCICKNCIICTISYM